MAARNPTGRLSLKWPKTTRRSCPVSVITRGLFIFVNPDWQKNLEGFLDQYPSAVGEIGIDRWKPDISYEGQEEVFLAQLAMATERNLPVSIHCLKA